MQKYRSQSTDKIIYNPSKFTKYFQLLFIDKFIQMDLKNLLDNQMKIHLAKLIDYHFTTYGYASVGSSSKTNEQIYDQQNSEFYVEQILLEDDDSLEKLNNLHYYKQQNLQQYQNIRFQTDSTFISFLNKSIRRLKIQKVVIETCVENNAWALGVNLDVFIKRIMAIKTFFPELFFSIIKQLINIIEQFRTTKNNKDEISTKQILISKYLSFIKIYTKKGDIIQAAKCVYSSKINKSIQQKINRLPDYQRMLNRIVLQQKRLAYGRSQSKNQIKLLQQSLKVHNSQQNAEKMRKSAKRLKKNNIWQKLRQINYQDWNPIDKPMYFNLQVLQFDIQLLDQDSNPQLNLSQSD